MLRERPARLRRRARSVSFSQADRDELYLYVDGRIHKLSEDVAAYRSTTEQIATDVGKLIEAGAARPGSIHWPGLDDDDHNRLWGELTAWIRDVLRRHPRSAKLLHPCWSEHTDAVDSTTSVWLTWVAAYDTPKAPAAESARWLKEWLPAFDQQVAEALARCGPTRCSLESDWRARAGLTA